VGHHPIYAQTGKADNERGDLQKRLDPILRRHDIDLYVCGHIHNFQYIRVPGSNIDYVVNTSASLSRAVKPTTGTQFCNGDAGFSVCSIDKDNLKLYMINEKGNVVHTVTRKK
jgi:hypothetical protein